MKLPRLFCFALLLSALAFGQEKKPATTPEKDIDPIALNVLKAATDPIKAAKSYSFRALVGREHLGTNGQIITLFHVTDATVERPDKLHLDIHGKGKEVQLFYNAGNAVLYAPSEKLFHSIAAAKTIDATLDDLEKRDVFIPIRNFLDSDPYHSLTDSLRTGYVVGQVTLFDQPVYHLAFTEAEAEWQLWVTAGDKPKVRRVQIIDKSEAYLPRITIDFLDWNFDITPSSDTFTFNKPADAKEVQTLPETSKKP